MTPDFSQEPSFFEAAFKADRAQDALISAFSEYCEERRIVEPVHDSDPEAYVLQDSFVKSIRGKLLSIQFAPSRFEFLTYRGQDTPVNSVISGVFIGGRDENQYAVPIVYSKRIRDEEVRAVTSLKLGLPQEEMREKKTGLGVETFANPIAICRAFSRLNGEIVHDDFYFLSVAAFMEAAERVELKSETINLEVEKSDGSPIPLCEDGTLLVAVAACEVKQNLRRLHGNSFFLNGINHLSVRDISDASVTLGCGYSATLFDFEDKGDKFLIPIGVRIQHELEILRESKGPIEAHTISYRESEA